MSTTLPTEGRIAYLYTDRKTPGPNLAATVTLPAVPGRRYVLREIDCGYSGESPTTGAISVSVGGTVIWGLTLPSSVNVYSWPFAWGLYGAENAEMVITLAAGTGATNASVGTLNVQYEQ